MARAQIFTLSNNQIHQLTTLRNRILFINSSRYARVINTGKYDVKFNVILNDTVGERRGCDGYSYE